MNNETNAIIESFQLKSNVFVSLLFKIQTAIESSVTLLNSSSEDKELSNLLNELNALMLNDDLITLVKDQQYELIALNEKYSTALTEISTLEEERECLSEKMQSLIMNRSDTDENSNQKTNAVSLSDYNNLKEEYLQACAKNTSYEQKLEEIGPIMSSYKQAKENLYLMTYSYEALQQEYEAKFKEFNERIASLIDENSDLKNQIREKHNHYSLCELEKRDINKKMNRLNRSNRVSELKIQSMEKINNVLKSNNCKIRTKLIKSQEENEEKIEEMKLNIQELEERIICLINEKKAMSKGFCKNFIQQFKNKYLSFHYIPTDNIIAVYFAEEKIGEVRNKSFSSIKKNQSNKLILKCKYILSDYPEVDDILYRKKTVKGLSLDENTLKNLDSINDCDNNNNNNDGVNNTYIRRSSISSKNLLNLLSWDYDNQLTFIKKDLSKIDSKNNNGYYHLKQISSITTDLIQNKTEHNECEDSHDEEESNLSVSIEELIENSKDDNCNEEETKKIHNSVIEDNKEKGEEENNIKVPMSNIDTHNMPYLLSLQRSRKQRQPDVYFSKNYYGGNNTQIKEGEMNQVILQDNVKENKCFYCLIF